MTACKSPGVQLLVDPGLHITRSTRRDWFLRWVVPLGRRSAYAITRPTRRDWILRAEAAKAKNLRLPVNEEPASQYQLQPGMQTGT